MIESVLTTRDKYLKEVCPQIYSMYGQKCIIPSLSYIQDGVMWPSSAELFLVPCSAAHCYEEKVKFWENVYGFDFSPLMCVHLVRVFSLKKKITFIIFIVQ